jgi:hypothetical protein
MHEARSQVGARVLVHCERGASRSASVVAAHLMATAALAGGAASGGSAFSAGAASRGSGSGSGSVDGVSMGADEILAMMREQRGCVQPNPGFLSYLRGLVIVPGLVAREVPSLIDAFGRVIRTTHAESVSESL